MTPDKLLFLLFSLLLSLIPPSCALTEYIGDNVTITATSVQPCHLFGDSDLFGVGVRASFYISWAVGLLGFLLGALNEMKAPRLSFNILLLTLTVILIRNTRGGSLALLEWYIVMGLAVLSSSTLFMVPMQPYELAAEEESERNNRPADNSSRHHSPARNGKPAEHRESGRPEDRTNNQKAATEGNTQPKLKTERAQAEEKTRQDAEARVQKFLLRGFYSDPLGLGFLLLLYGLISCCLPWLYFMKPSSGRKEGCAVPIFLFGTWDMFNKHWQGFLKFVAVAGVLSGALYALFGIFVVYRGVKMRKTYALTLELMKERRYSGIKLLRLDVGNLKRALDEAQPATITETQIAYQQLAKAIQWARRQEEEAAAGEEQAKNLVKRASKLQVQYWAQHVLLWVFQGVFFVALAFSGSLSIWFIEKTIEKNQIDMDDDFGSSSGQLLALLVALLTTVNFLWEVFKSKWEERGLRKEAEEIVDDICKASSSLHLQAARQGAVWRSIADQWSGAWQYYSSVGPPSSASVAKELSSGISTLGSFFRSQPKDQQNNIQV
ncbi:Fc.00g025430.m01.CDS01 [Cosmosporella sp. VM-42]